MRCSDNDLLRNCLSNAPVKRKSLLALLALSVLLVGALPAMAGPATPVTIRVDTPTVPLQPGQEFSIHVVADQAIDLGSFEFGLLFDPLVVNTTVDDLALGPFLGSTGRATGELRREGSSHDGTGPVFAAYSYGEDNGPRGSGVLVVVEMSALVDGVTEISLDNPLVTDTEGNLLEAVVSPGRVQVGDPLPVSYPVFLPMLLRR